MPVARKAKYQLIAEGFKRDILSGKIAPGQMLPSQKEMIARYSVALGTVRQAINQLVADGWVRTEHGRGMFAEDPSEVNMPAHSQRQQTVGFAVIGPYFSCDPVSQMLLDGVTSVLRPAGKEVTYAVFHKGDSFRDDLEVFLEGLPAVLLYEIVDWKGVQFADQALSLAREKGAKTVLVGYPISCKNLQGGYSNVSADAENAGYLAGQVLALHGQEKIAFVREVESDWSLALQRGLMRACEEYEIGYDVAANGSYIERDREGELAVAEKVSQEHDLTGLVVMGDRHACRLIQDISARGVSVPEQKSVVAIGGLPRHQLSERSLARVNIRYDVMGQQAAKTLLGGSEGYVQIAIPPRFERGDSLRDINGVVSEQAVNLV